ncbi:D-tyrosyl-tRNA(Tyr) deacylase [Candidatus Poribacteria bacterium]|nr:D-tyrosyl-tRNA(Tyr) deacylase [Candidatus Poribacteria bacterium]
MRAVIQRVSQASVVVDGKTQSSIGFGFVVLLGVADGDGEADIAYLAEKIAHLRVFPDDESRMNRSLLDVGGSALVISQFTLFGDCRRGRRPSFTDAARPEDANRLYEAFVEALRARGVPVETGVFQAHMEVSLVNDGPVTLLLDSGKTF